MKFILLINVKVLTNVGIVTFTSRRYTKYSGYKARKLYTFQYFGLMSSLTVGFVLLRYTVVCTPESLSLFYLLFIS